LELLHVPKFREIDKPTIDEKIRYAFKEKERLAKIAIDKDKMLSVREFKAQIKKEFSSDGIDLKNVPPRKELREYEADVLRKSWTSARSRVEKCQKEIKSYRKAIDKIDFVLAEKGAERGNDLPDRKGRFQDWTDSKNNVNFCTGCENDCLYCYSRKLGYDSGWVEKGQWHKMKIRPDDVDKKRNLRDGLVGFPTSHDILPSNIDAYLIVLGKLLRAGNEVLIVSKPRFECIKRICDASQFFKDKILFRFTIGAMDDEILSFWEPNAPKYQERKKCLEYAFKNGFRTSVSIEPMLDTPNNKALINDLYSLVSDDIWLGIMKNLNRIEEDADDRLKQKIRIIKDGQRWYKLAPIYITYKDDPKIKWKTDAWRFSGWEKEIFQTENDTEIETTTPLIISASRLTDLPGFYSDWFIDRLRCGYLVKRHPRNPKIKETISFSKTRLIVFWTKNPEPMFKYLDEIDQKGIGYYFQYTLNDYDNDNLEPNLPSLQKRIEYFRTLSEKIGKERVIWRFDPLIQTHLISKDNLIDKVHGVMSQLEGLTEKFVISFLKKAGINYRDFSEDDKNYVAERLGKMGEEFGMEVVTCAEKNDLSRYGIGQNKCIDDGLIRRAFSKDDVLMEFIGDGTGLKDKGQREQCGCIVSKDIGERNTCLHLCKYCYANDSENAVKENFKRISRTGEMLLPDLPN
jgi:DNA repair photolyase